MTTRFKSSAIILLFSFMMTLLPVSAYAVEENETETYTYVEDLGNDFTVKTTLTIAPEQARTSSKRATKIQVIEHRDREIATVKLIATFSYDGTTARVTSTSYEKDTALGWLYARHNITTSGGRATLTADLISAIGTVPINITIRCTPAGVIT
ncbi:MAG: hypothetical protein HFF00_08180 [Ruminiclostridium sp.]|jgi:hypothetical protein|nr:hypothetical protein [Ruminiclostridium sp.]